MNEILCTVDVVLLTLKDGGLQVALLKRDRQPFKGTAALPGGFVHIDEDGDARDAALRVLREKAALEVPYLEQLATFSGPARDRAAGPFRSLTTRWCPTMWSSAPATRT